MDGFKLNIIFDELLAKLMYLLPQSIWGKMVRATGFGPVNVAFRPLKTLDLFLGTDLNRFINNSLLVRILFTTKL